MLCKKVKKKATLDRSILIVEAWVHFLQQYHYTRMMMMMMTIKPTNPNTDISTLILNESVSASVFVSVPEK